MRELSLTVERCELRVPFHITGHVFTGTDVLLVQLSGNGATGRGEASGVYYFDENGASMLEQAESVRQAVEDGISRETLRRLLPSGGARNAIDCALWDLEAKLSGKSIWQLTGIEPDETRTFQTVGLESPEKMAQWAKSIPGGLIKVKLDGNGPLERVAAVCNARPDATVIVDCNQGWTFEQLVELAPAFHELGVAMIEQPLPRGGDEALEGYVPPLPVCADESCVDTSEFEQAARRYQMINIKLDKTGGLTEALDLASRARERGIGLMVGNMLGTSLAMAPAFVVAQLCRFTDLDGPLYLERDCDHALTYTDGLLSPPTPALWG
ncbi:MAG: dipeptide epimerase [Lysobacterales bacterium]|jgi:L-alanine-DL-glutamate epimerase-like enolase superfamily enzyme